MKTVFTNQELAHVWAQQKQASGRSEHMFFRDSTIFSYGEHFPIARFKNPATVYFTTKGYSVTTAKHKGYVRQALRAGPIYVYNVMASSKEEVAENVRDLLHSMGLKLHEALNGSLFSSRMESLDRMRANAFAYIDAEGFKPSWFAKTTSNKESARLDRVAFKKFMESDGTWAGFGIPPAEEKRLMERERRHADAQKARWDNRNAIAAAKEAENLEKWKAGEDVRDYFVTMALRVKGEEIQTSRGASIPLAVARKLWDRIKGGAIVSSPVAGMSLGHYTVDSWDGATLVAGCHSIPRAELDRMAGVLGW